MKIEVIGVGARLALCLLIFSPMIGRSADANRPSIKIPPNRELSQRFAKVNEVPRRSSPHRVTAAVSSGADTWQVAAAPSGLMTPIATKKRLPVRITLHFPLAEAGQKAVVTLLNEGKMKLQQPTGEAESAPAVSKVLTAIVGPSRTVRLHYEFGQTLHNQKIEAKVGLARAILNLHLHDGSDGH